MEPAGTTMSRLGLPVSRLAVPAITDPHQREGVGDGHVEHQLTESPVVGVGESIDSDGPEFV